MIIDTSSAILLYKSGWMERLMASYQLVTGPTVFAEMTVVAYPGATAFARWHRENRLLLQVPSAAKSDPPAGRRHLDPGESECLNLYETGAGAFILIDDGPGAAFCRRGGIPYVNALLVPRLLKTGADPGADVKADLQEIFRLGRYAPWIMAFAMTCPRERLSFFLP